MNDLSPNALPRTFTERLREQASAIYEAWDSDNPYMAKELLRSVDPANAAYVVMTVTILAVSENRQYDFSKFIEGVTL